MSVFLRYSSDRSPWFPWSLDGKAQSAFLLYVNGCELQGQERMGHEAGTILETDIPVFLVKLGKTVAASGKGFHEWFAENPDGIDNAAKEFTEKTSK